MNDTQSPGWERQLLEKLAFASLKEQKSKRRWGLFFKFFWLLLALAFGMRLFFGDSKGLHQPVQAHTALVQLRGVIDDGSSASAENINRALRTAFEASSSKGVILAIDSPGGSPVQSGLIYKEIKRLRAKYPDKPLYAVVGEMCASGGYYVAAAADKIYADQASLVGSIGVIMDGFGFTGLMEKVGVERRVYTAGENKALLDPFSAQKENQKVHLNEMLGEVHQQFIKAVKDGRGKALKESPDLFSGLVWTGSKSMELGLIDGIGHVEAVARDVVKVEEIYDYTLEENIADRLAKRLGASFGTAVGRVLLKAGTVGGWRLQ
jgi:protease IV